MKAPGVPVILSKPRLRWAALALVAACTPRAPTTAPARAPAVPPVETIAAQLEARQGETTVEGMFKATIRTSRGRNRLDGALLAQRDMGLRIELFSMIGPPVAYAAVTPARADIYLPLADSAFLESEAPDQVLFALTGGAIDTAQFIGLFLGQLPPCQLQAPVEFAPTSGRFEVACTDENSTYRLGLDPETLLVTHIATVSSGPAAAFVCDLGDYRAVGSSQLPFRIRLEVGETFQADVRFTSIDVREPASQDAFTLQPPPGARIVPLESVLAPVPGDSPAPSQ